MDTLDLCPRCAVLFVSPKDNIDLLLQSVEKICNTIPRLAASAGVSDVSGWKCIKAKSTPCPDDSVTAADTTVVCPVCYNALVGDSLQRIKDAILTDLKIHSFHEQQRPIFLNFISPPVVDAARLATRLIVTRTADRTFSFPPLHLLLQRLLTVMLTVDSGLAVPLRIVDDMATAEVQVNVLIDFKNQTEFCLAMMADFRQKTKKRKLGEVVLESGDDEAFEVSRTDSDRVLLWFKGLDEGGTDALQVALTNYMATSASPISWTIHSIPRPIYLLGRYRKLARDVPQSRWTVGEERKGRNSVEEIISEVLVDSLQAKSCKMHPCGREDIDVRCLGNGRPFIIEVTQARAWPVNIQLAAALRVINSSAGLNAGGDVEVSTLAVSSRAVWEQMQTVAEEKRKAYSCVCWSAARITRAKLQVLEDVSTDPANVDEEGRPCLKIIQKTPLRVLHRRSLLDRPRYVYKIETVILNDHYFIMNLRTSAGTYVKEFVHGDLGRTVPSVCSLLGSQADILQLDVVWLFDDFEGGGEPPERVWSVPPPLPTVRDRARGEGVAPAAASSSSDSNTHSGSGGSSCSGSSSSSGSSSNSNSVGSGIAEEWSHISLATLQSLPVARCRDKALKDVTTLDGSMGNIN